MAGGGQRAIFYVPIPLVPFGLGGEGVNDQCLLLSNISFLNTFLIAIPGKAKKNLTHAQKKSSWSKFAPHSSF